MNSFFFKYTSDFHELVSAAAVGLGRGSRVPQKAAEELREHYSVIDLDQWHI